MSNLHWFRATLMCTNEQRASAHLWQADAKGVEIHDHDTYFEGVERTPLAPNQKRLVAYFELDPSTDATEHLRQTLSGLAPVAHLLDLSPYTDTSWQTAWKDYFHPRRLSPRAIVCPPWNMGEDIIQPDDARIIIEPGMAFGTGTHETTQLVAQILDDFLISTPSPSILDVGTGSAILSMLAVKLAQPTLVHGIDIDPDAIDNAKANLALNDIDPQRVTLSTDPLNDIEPQFDLVLANILAHILLALQPELQAHTKPGGTLILSGMIEDQVPTLQQAFDHPDWSIISHHQLDPWHALVLKRLR